MKPFKMVPFLFFLERGVEDGTASPGERSTQTGKIQKTDGRLRILPL